MTQGGQLSFPKDLLSPLPGLHSLRHFPRDTFESPQTFRSLFNVSWDCLWVMLKSLAVFVFVV